MASDANESMAERSPTSPSSDVAEDDGILSALKFCVHFYQCFVVGLYVLNIIICIISVSLNGDMSDHCFGHIPLVISFSYKYINY